MRRREFIAGLGSAAAWPLTARAQQAGRVRRVEVLAGAPEGDASQNAWLAALWEGLAKLGWADGRNLRIEVRFAAGGPPRFRALAADLVSLAPDVIVVEAPTVATRAVQQETRTIPIVFMQGGDPVLNGLVRSIARPEGNTTGFSNFAPPIAGKWLELLKETAPRLTRMALVFNSELLSPAASPAYISLIETPQQCSRAARPRERSDHN